MQDNIEKKKEKTLSLCNDFWWGALVAVMAIIIWMLLCFGTPLHELCGTSACIQMENN